MNAIYRTHFQIKGKQPGPQLAHAVADICWKWLFDPRRNYALPSPIPAGCVSVPSMVLSPTANAEAMAITDNQADLWVLALTHADTRDAAGVWRTEIGIERTAHGKVFFSCSLYLGRANRSVAPFRRDTSRPKIVLEILKQFDGYGAGPLTYKPIFLKADTAYVDALVKMLQDPRRHHPVVYVSTHEQSRRPFFDVGALAEQLAGTAYVVAAESLDACRAFRQQMPAHLQAFDGAVRLYWPGFTLRSRQSDHPFWTKDSIVSLQTRSRNAFSKTLLAHIAAVAVTSMPDSLLTWAKAAETARHHAIAQARAARDDQQLLQLYVQENDDQRNSIVGLKQEIQTERQERYRLQARLAALESAAAQTQDIEEILPVDTVSEAIDRATERWPDQLLFALNAKSNEFTPFQPATEVLDAFEWLATIYYQAKLGKTKVTNLDHSIRETISGWSYSPHQSGTSVTTYREWYECHWEDRVYTASEHIGTGSSKRPEETIRIGFAWDKPRKKVIVGFIGQHQKNTKS